VSAYARLGCMHNSTLFACGPEIKAQILNLGMLPAAGFAREGLQPFIHPEMERWGKIVKEGGLAGTQCCPASRGDGWQ
jgi:hypothetical protein